MGSRLLNQHFFQPASFDQLNAVQIADPKVIFFVCHRDVDGRNIQSLVFSEKGDPFDLEEMGTYCIDSYGIRTYNQSFIGPNVSLVERMGSPSIKLRCQGTEDIQAGLSLYNGVSPNFTQRRATLIMVGRRVWNKHNVVFQASPYSGPVMRSKGSHIDKRSSILEDRVIQNSPIINIDIFIRHPYIQ